MKRLINFLKQLRLGQVLAILVAGMLLITNTACSDSNVRNAATDNLPVQVGGNNNPHKAGGDNSSNSKMSFPQVDNRSRSALPTDSLIAATNADATKKAGSNYPDKDYTSNNAKAANAKIGTRQQEDFVKDATQLPKQRQTIPDSDSNLLEKVGENFKESSDFIGEGVKEAPQRPELQPNPALPG